METIDFGCQVRCLNRQKLIPGSTHPQLNQCASKFLAKVKKEVNSAPVSQLSSGGNETEGVGWMKLKLSQRGLRIFPTGSSSSGSSFSTSSSSSSSSSSLTTENASGPAFNLSSSHRKSDEGFESDSEHSDALQPNGHSGGSSSGVNSSSSDLEEPESMDVNGMRSSKKKGCYFERMLPIRCGLSDILSCQHPPALGRHVVLLTLRSADDSALDILALECSAEEPAGILTLLCQKISSMTSTSVQPTLHIPAKSAASLSSSTTTMTTTTTTATTTKATVSVQSWSEREKMLDALIDSTKPSATKSIIRQLERQHSEWNLIQRRTDDGVTHLQVSGMNFNHKNVVNNVVAGGVRKLATTSGMLVKKAMPSGGSLGQLARLETTLAITNSHSASPARSSDANSHPPLPAIHKKNNNNSAAGLKRSDTMHQKLVPTNKASGSSSCILSLQTPELPLTPAVANASTSTSDAPTLPVAKSRWSFGAPFRQQVQAITQRPISPDVSRRNSKQRGRSCERKPTIGLNPTNKKAGQQQQQQQQQRQSDLDGLFISSSGSNSRNSNPTAVAPTKIKRDPSKTRSFLMKLTSSASRKSPTPPSTPPPPLPPLSSNVPNEDPHPRQRGRSLVRLRSSTRLQSPPPPPSSNNGSANSSQTFLIPTKSGGELTRNIYPKEGCRSGPSQPVFHLLAGSAGGRGGPSHRYNGPVTAGPNGWASYCWNEALRHPVAFSPSDANNNQQPQHQQQWIYFHPHPVAAAPPPSAAVLKAASDFKRIQRSRSQSPGRRNSQRLLNTTSSRQQQQQQQQTNLWLAPPPPQAVGHYYALPVSTGPSSIQQPVSLPPDVSHLSSRGQEPCRSFRRSKSSTRLSSRHLQTKSERYGSSSDRLANNKAVTFHAFATVQLVD